MTRTSPVRFWVWAGAAVLLAGVVPVAAVLGSAAADNAALHVTVACLLPVLVGMAFHDAPRTYLLVGPRADRTARVRKRRRLRGSLPRP
ncbi:unannotated protein [freshwater metagenome]|jgi:hypothetical protein|uniref:Unannotated protein n=1 Tax=freshwater metagenome TaxID=449393 RepID=A0A6J7JL90_9ZZZZ|nr:hypothetical protein [Actinomycetota bacterium]